MGQRVLRSAGGATRAALHDPALITTLVTFSLPNTIWAGFTPTTPAADSPSAEEAEDLPLSHGLGTREAAVMTRSRS